MSIITVNYVLFLLLSCTLYYLLPGKLQWQWLLVCSIFFCISSDVRGVIYLALLTIIIYFCGRILTEIDQNAEHSKKEKKAKKKKVVTCGVLLLLSVLVVLKCNTAAIHVINKIAEKCSINWNIPMLDLFIPLGISYYTLQAISYILDVCWGRIPAETSFVKLLTYLSYFPLLIQGPISRYDQLSAELFPESRRRFSIKNVKFGVQLMLWGYFKKMVIADRVAGFVQDIFYTNETPYGLVVFYGLVLFGIQLYCDFSGGIDVIRGTSECFGIRLALNFNQPFFSKSLSEFWRRWHISLGSWMKDYVFFPLSMSKAMNQMKKQLKQHTRLSKKSINRIPMALANLLVFALTGLWHGTGSRYLGWGLYNGIIIAGSLLLEDVYISTKNRLGIREESKIWNGFRIARTFFVITVGWVFDCADTAPKAIRLMFNMLKVWKTDFGMIYLNKSSLAIIAGGVFLLLVVGIFHEKKISIRQVMDSKGYWTQVVFWTVLFQLIAALAHFDVLGGDDFLYANF